MPQVVHQSHATAQDPDQWMFACTGCQRRQGTSSVRKRTRWWNQNREETRKCEEDYPIVYRVSLSDERLVTKTIPTAFPITPMQAILGPDILETSSGVLYLNRM